MHAALSLVPAEPAALPPADADPQAPEWQDFLASLADAPPPAAEPPRHAAQPPQDAGDAAAPALGDNRTALQRWVAADQAAGALGCGFGAALELPLCLRNPGVAVAVWHHWFGGARQAARALEALLEARTAETAAIARQARRSNPAAALSLLLGNPSLGARLLERLPARERELADPTRRLAGQLRELLGAEYAALEQRIAEASAVELAAAGEARWPWLAWLHARGAYLGSQMATLLQLGLLHERLAAHAWSGAERSRALLAGALLLQRLPPRLAVLLAIHAPALRECAAQPFRFFGLDGGNLDPARPVWEQLDPQVARETLAYLLCAEAAAGEADQPGARGEVRRLEAQLVMHGSLPRTFAELYRRFCAEEAQPRYRQLRESLARHGAALEVPLRDAALPAELVGRPLDFAAIADPARLQQRLRRLIEAEARCIDLPALLADSGARLDSLQAAHAEILALGRTPSVSGLLRIAERAEAARQEILANRDWFAAALAATRPYVALWETFYADVAALQPTPAKCGERRGREAPASPPAAPAGSTDAALAGLHQQLHDAREDAARLREELRQARGEQHRLQQRSAALGSVAPRAELPVVDAALLRRVSNARAGLQPAEVLAYFAQLGGARVEVLDSAWRGAADYPGRFAGVERMFELLDKLLFPYLDAIAAGTPDCQARSVFGSKAYSAKESDSTRSDARLRAMREFVHRGEKRLFERHLRVSNATGAEGMRIYFDIIDGRVVIAYVGPHLPVSTSN